MKLNIVKSIVFSKFGSENVPYWLAYGVAAMTIHYGNPTHSFKHIPSLEELEKSNSNDFIKIDGFQTAYEFTKFIKERLGRQTLIDLLSHYDSRKEKLFQIWIDSLNQPMSLSQLNFSSKSESKETENQLKFFTGIGSRILHRCTSVIEKNGKQHKA